jgi:hypothetical protein
MIKLGKHKTRIGAAHSGDQNSVATFNPHAEAGTVEPDSLIWHQSLLAWLALHPNHADDPNYANDQEAPIDGPTDKEVGLLCAHLLTLGGTQVAVIFDDMGPCRLIREEARLVDNPKVIRRKGRMNRCHDNAAKAWLAKPSDYRFVTGYGLNTGCWRRHSWLLNAKNQIVETTIRQEKYLGVVLNADRAIAFCLGQDWFASPKFLVKKIGAMKRKMATKTRAIR